MPAPKIPPRLVAMDLDGTLVAPGEEIIPAALEALGHLAERGVLLTTASGRDYLQQLPLVKKYGLGLTRPWPHFLMTNELFLYRRVERQGGWDKEFTPDQAALESYAPLEPHYSQHLAHWREHADEAIEIMNETIARLKAEGVVIERASADAFVRERALIDAYLFGTENALAAFGVLKQVLGDRPWLRPNCVQGGNGKYHIQMTPSRGGKGYALLALAKHVGIDPVEVLAVGDSGNDEDMLAVSRPFQKATLSNGDPHIKELVRAGGGYVAEGSIAEGLLEVLAHYGLD